MDPLSDVLSLLRLRSYISGAVDAGGDWCFAFPAHDGIKFRAILSGACWLEMEGLAQPILFQAGDCFLLPLGRAFRIGTRLDIPAVAVTTVPPAARMGDVMVLNGGGDSYSIGGYCALEGPHAGFLLGMLPPVLRIRNEAAKTVLRWCIEQMREEMCAARPGGDLMAQQLAQMLLVQALRAHLREAGDGVGWLFALADARLAAAITAIHAEPARSWSVAALARIAGLSRTGFALRFRERVGQSPMEYLTRWRMLRADDRLRHSRAPIAAVALSVGYGSESAFSAAFKRVMGEAPRRHAKQAA